MEYPRWDLPIRESKRVVSGGVDESGPITYGTNPCEWGGMKGDHEKRSRNDMQRVNIRHGTGQ